MKTQIKQLSNGDVSVSLDQMGERVTEVFTCPTAGGYVRTSKGRQVCKRLSWQGSTISASADTLLAVIRREYKSAVNTQTGFCPL
jgi:hypothetical protein